MLKTLVPTPITSHTIMVFYKLSAQTQSDCASEDAISNEINTHNNEEANCTQKKIKRWNQSPCLTSSLLKTLMLYEIHVFGLDLSLKS